MERLSGSRPLSPGDVGRPTTVDGLVANRRGVALPVVVIALAVLAALAVAALRTGVDERMTSTAVRKSSAAFYAAEAGLHQTWAAWNDTSLTLDSLVQELQMGDSLVRPWQTLLTGDRYRAVIHRWHQDGDQPLFQIVAEGEHEGGGVRALGLWLTPGGSSELGSCCKSAATVRGTVRLKHDSHLTGLDGNPPAWDPATCPVPGDRAGVIVQNTSDFQDWNNSTYDGAPPLELDTLMADSTFNDYGGLTWDEIKGLADHVIGIEGTEFYPNTASPGNPTDPLGPLAASGLPLDPSDNWIGSRHNPDGTCNRDHPLNWGSGNSADPCYDYFPVILIVGEIEVRGEEGYGQGIFLMGPNGVFGAEFEFEICHSRPDDPSCPGFDVVGIIVGRGCVEIEDRTRFYGAVFVDGNFPQASCEDPPLQLTENATLQFSTCAVQRALDRSGLGAAAGGTMARLHRRAFTELLR